MPFHGRHAAIPTLGACTASTTFGGAPTKDTHHSENPCLRTTGFPTDIMPRCAHTHSMTQARAQLVPPDYDGIYYCVQRENRAVWSFLDLPEKSVLTQFRLKD